MPPMILDPKRWLPRKYEPMTEFTSKAWLRSRHVEEFGGGDIHTKMRRYRDQLSRELELATDDQLRELGKGLYFMGYVRAELVIGEAQRRGLR